jgi:hypothetical protein
MADQTNSGGGYSASSLPKTVQADPAFKPNTVLALRNRYATANGMSTSTYQKTNPVAQYYQQLGAPDSAPGSKPEPGMP